MSDKWEVVTKSKKSKAAAVIDTNGSSVGPQKATKNTLKMEDILPRDQLQSLYSLNDSVKKSSGNNTTNATAKKPNTSTKPKLPDALIPAQKQKTSVPHRPRPKNLEAGLAALNIPEVESVLESYKSSFPDSHLVWLKAVVAHLNGRLNVDTDPTFFGKSPNYPANIVPAALKALIYQTLTDAGVSNVHYFFDQTLTTLAVDQSKNLPVIGHKILLQLIAIEWPTVCVKSLAKTAILRNSYQNRPPIGLGLLWALGQGGYRDVSTGLRVWQNIMLPVLDIKAYTRFVCEYVQRILQRAADDDGVDLSADELFRTFDDLSVYRQSLPKELQALLTESATLLLTKYIRSNSKITPVFVILFKRLSGGVKSSQESVLTDGLVECLERDTDCLKAWRIHFRKYAAESNVLLRALNKRDTSLIGTPSYKTFLSEVHGILDSIPEAKVDDEIRETNRLVKSSQDKSANSKSSSAAKSCRRCCGWTIGIVLLLGAIVAALAYDTHIHGNSFARSATGKFLQQTGAMPYVDAAWVKTMGPAARGYQWAERHAPVYAAQAYTVLRPYGVFVHDTALVAWAAAVRGSGVACDCYHQKAPVVVAFVEQYVPGLPQKVGDATVQLWTSVQGAYVVVFDYFKTKVFVGQLSPESLNLALNRTQVAAAQLNQWFHARVELFAKYK